MISYTALRIASSKKPENDISCKVKVNIVFSPLTSSQETLILSISLAKKTGDSHSSFILEICLLFSRTIIASSFMRASSLATCTFIKIELSCLNVRFTLDSSVLFLISFFKASIARLKESKTA